MFWNGYIWVLVFSQCTCCGPLLTTAVQEMVQNFSTLSKSHKHLRKMPDRGSCSKMGLQNYIQELIYFFQPALWMIAQGKTWKGKKCLCVISLVRVCVLYIYIYMCIWDLMMKIRPYFAGEHSKKILVFRQQFTNFPPWTIDMNHLPWDSHFVLQKIMQH